MSISDTSYDYWLTLWLYYIPPSIALLQVWARLLAGYFAPVGLAFILVKERLGTPAPRVLGFLTLGSSWFILTDDQYVLEFGRAYGLVLTCASLLCLRRVLRGRLMQLACFYIILYILSPFPLDDPKEIPEISSGLYHNVQKQQISDIVRGWVVPEYSQIATRWQMTGDARTGLPYLMNGGPEEKKPRFHRVWLPTIDDEFVALDISFPKGGHDPSHPLYLILHGLNGGSEEGYVVDMTASRTEEGSTVVVMIARGLMDTPIQGWTVSMTGIFP